MLGSMPEDSNEVANGWKFLWDIGWFSWILRDPNKIMH